MEHTFQTLSVDDSRYDSKAFLIVLRALRIAAPEKRHVSGQELAHTVLELSRELFGLSAGLVLGEWGLHSTRDIGEIVYVMVQRGLIRAAPEDSIDDFDGVFDLHQELEHNYPWMGQ